MSLRYLRGRLGLGLIVLASFVGVFLVQSYLSNANAEVASPDATVGFCGNVLLGPQGGGGAQTWCQAGFIEAGLYQAYAYGEHSVCVEIEEWNTRRCSTGTEGVYSGETPAGHEYGTPTIQNNTNTNNHASGIYLTR
jgi:hypothetical protein